MPNNCEKGEGRKILIFHSNMCQVCFYKAVVSFKAGYVFFFVRTSLQPHRVTYHKCNKNLPFRAKADYVDSCLLTHQQFSLKIKLMNTINK